MITPTPAPATTNIDPAEVDQFDRQAALWWDATGPFRLLHKIGPLRLAYVREEAMRHFGLDEQAARPYAGMTFLDVGCGGGLISEPLRRLGGKVVGIDPAAKNVGTAQAHARVSGLDIDYRSVQAEDLAADGLQFDVVVCLEVIEHVPDPAAFAKTLASLVKPGGLLVLSTLNRTAKSFVLAIVGAEYILGWLPRGTHDWNRFITPRELERYTAAAGMGGFSAQGMIYDPLRDTWQLSTDTAVNYLAHCTRPGV